jgi:cytochrome c
MKKTMIFLALATLGMAAKPGNTGIDPVMPADVEKLVNKYGCNACHAVSRKMVGPMWTDIAAKAYSKKKIVALVRKPEPANWPGYPAMAAQPTVPKADLEKIADWLISIKK